MYRETLLTFQEQIEKWAMQVAAVLNQPKIIDMEGVWTIISYKDILLLNAVYLVLFFAMAYSAYKVGRESMRNDLTGGGAE